MFSPFFLAGSEVVFLHETTEGLSVVNRNKRYRQMMMAVLLVCEVLTADVSLYAPTPVVAIEAMLKLAEVTKDDFVYDLGCGEGHILVVASALGCRSAGFDIDAKCVAAANRNIEDNKLWHLARADVGDVLTADFSRASVVTLYLMPDLLKKLRSRLADQLAPGTRIVCFEKPIPGVKPSQKMETPDYTLYLYRMPLVPVTLPPVPVKCEVACTGNT
jgi:SAM-dependent methyltransferase